MKTINQGVGTGEDKKGRRTEGDGEEGREKSLTVGGRSEVVLTCLTQVKEDSYGLQVNI